MGRRAGGALLIVRADDADEALRTLDNDPFNVANLIEQRVVRPWRAVLGPWGDIA